MKKTLAIIALLSSAELWALGPADIANKTVRIDMENAQVARSDMYQDAALPWYLLNNITDFIIDFPASRQFTTTTSYIGRLSNEVNVSYSPDTENSKGYVKVECHDFQVLVVLTYTGPSSGTATITWHQAGDTRHFRNTTFTLQDDADAASCVKLPEEIIFHDPEIWDDGLQEILSEIERAQYRSATDKLYQQRLSSLLPLIMMTRDVSFTNPDYKGNTALHYACGLSHTRLVQWLVEHGADLEARTDRGASVDACIGGRNAGQIRTILQEARAWRDRPYSDSSVSLKAARKAARWLETEFSGSRMTSPEYSIPTDTAYAEECARLIYRSTKAGNGPSALGMDLTENPGILLTRVQNGRVSEDMFTQWVLRELRQSYLFRQHTFRRDGYVLAQLPHMMLAREDEGMPPDGSTAVYRAACEGNVELVRWLISHGADRSLTDRSGQPASLPANTPNLAEIQEALQMRD